MRVLYIEKIRYPNGWAVYDERGSHVYFKHPGDREGQYVPIGYFSSKALALRAIREAYPGAVVAKGRTR